MLRGDVGWYQPKLKRLVNKKIQFHDSDDPTPTPRMPEDS